jgi:hypothetical protein
MADLVGRVDAWETFADGWRKLLADENINRFDPASLEFELGEYKGWSNTRKISVQQRAFILINQARDAVLGHSVLTTDFHLRFVWVKEPHEKLKS